MVKVKQEKRFLKWKLHFYIINVKNNAFYVQDFLTCIFSIIFLLSFMEIRRKYRICKSSRHPVFDGFTCFDVS